jgi:hypothetical protein
MTQTAYPSNNAESLRQLASAADVYLQGQLAAAIAADQRALVFAGFLAAAIAATGGAAITVLTNSTSDHFLGKLAIGSASGLLAAMLFAVIAARPVHWFFPGSHPLDWRDDFASNKPEVERLQELLEDYDERITNNHKTMKANSDWIQRSAICGFVTLLMSGAILVVHIW